jgi:hypothetical protein
MSHYPIRFINGRPIRDANLQWSVREAAAGGFMKDAFVVQKFGENQDAAGSEEYLWSESGAYTWMTTPQQLKVASVGAAAGNDDGAPLGTGARTLELQGLDENWDLLTETITLNGATAVTTTNKFIRCFRAKVLTAGSTGGNEGAINVYDNGGANQVAHIPIGYNQTMQAIYTVPADYTAWLLRWYASSASNQTIDVFLRTKDNKVANFPSLGQVKHKIHVFRGFADEELLTPIRIGPQTDVWMSTIASAASDVAGGFDLICFKTSD